MSSSPNPTASPILALPEALAQFQAASDTTHRFWGYYQVVAAGAAAFAWSEHMPDDPWTRVALSVAFGMFCVVNGWLVWSSQREANALSDYIATTFFPGATSSSAGLAGLYAAKSRSLDARGVAAMHAFIGIAVIAAIWWKSWSRTGIVCAWSWP